MTQARVLIVHPEPSILALLGSMLQSLGHQIDEAANDRARGPPPGTRRGIDLVIAGVNPADPEAMELVSLHSAEAYAGPPWFCFFPGPHPERAREALRMGATTVLKFPMPATELRAVSHAGMRAEHLFNGHKANSRAQTAPTRPHLSGGIEDEATRLR